jgi:hypothetical protein
MRTPGSDVYFKDYEYPVCDWCGASINVDLHHHDYSFPWRMTPLCRSCHRWLSRKLRFLAREAAYREAMHEAAEAAGVRHC